MLTRTVNGFPMEERDREADYKRYGMILLLVNMAAAGAWLCVRGTALNLTAARQAMRLTAVQEAVHQEIIQQESIQQENVQTEETSFRKISSERTAPGAYDLQTDLRESTGAVPAQRVIEYEILEKEPARRLSDGDYETLLRIVEAEAGGEDENGKLLVANVVLNRVDSSLFPDTVTEVVYQQEFGICQFSPVSDGRINRVKVSEETRRAVERAVYEGEDRSEGALYFAARSAAASDRMQWFDRNLTWLFAYGGHEFYE